VGSGMRKADIRAVALVLAAFTSGILRGQIPQPSPSEPTQTATTTAAPLAFEVVSVKLAPPGAFPPAPAFMRDRGAPIRGLQIMTAPVAYVIAYAYRMQMSEFSFALRKQPDWVKTRNYTFTFRTEGEPTRDQVREMMRTMLADRFGLQVHEFTRDGTVNKLVLNKSGVLGPNIKPHAEGANCVTQKSASMQVPDASTQPKAQCGMTWYYLPGGVVHIGMVNATIASVGSSLASFSAEELGARPVGDATGLSGSYDVTLEFRSEGYSSPADSEADDDGVPTLIRAMKEQLGLRVETGQGPVRMVSIDHISEPTPN
jgi:uncharacterized protein (TIGR03435 family)